MTQMTSRIYALFITGALVTEGRQTAGRTCRSISVRAGRLRLPLNSPQIWNPPKMESGVLKTDIGFRKRILRVSRDSKTDILFRKQIFICKNRYSFSKTDIRLQKQIFVGLLTITTSTTSIASSLASVFSHSYSIHYTVDRSNDE